MARTATIILIIVSTCNYKITIEENTIDRDCFTWFMLNNVDKQCLHLVCDIIDANALSGRDLHLTLLSSNLSFKFFFSKQI